VARELSSYELDLVGVQEVRWDKRGTLIAEDYTFFFGKRKRKITDLEQDIFGRDRIVSE
jgi:hypothetical protein